MKILFIEKNHNYSQTSYNLKKANVSFQGAITTKLITSANTMRNGKNIHNKDFASLVKQAYEHVKKFLETPHANAKRYSKDFELIQEIEKPGHFTAGINSKKGHFNLVNFDEGDRIYFEAEDNIAKLNVYDPVRNHGFAIHKNLQSGECRFIELSNNN